VPRLQRAPQRTGVAPQGPALDWSAVAFLDEEQEEYAPPAEPERPRRFEGPERRRQQFLLRRLIAVGVGLAFLILLVLGFRSCLEARSDRGLRDYTESIATTMQESEQRGDEFFELVDNPGDTSEQQFEQQVNSQRNYAQSLLDRAENVGVPGQMEDAQSAVVLTLKMRRNALQAIAENIGSATADAETAGPVETITNAMSSLYSSDIVWTTVGSPEMSAVLDSEGVDTSELPAGNFMPEGTQALEYLDQTTIVERLGGITGEEAASGTQGLGITGVSIGDVTLDPDTTTEVSDDAREVTVQVQNQGEVDEGGIQVEVTVDDGEPLTKTIEEIAAGDTGEVTIPLTSLPQPGTEAQLDVFVQPVPSEAVTTNNQAAYSVIFGATTTP
jgi:CARDB